MSSSIANAEKCGVIGMTGQNLEMADFHEAHQKLQHRGDGMSGVSKFQGDTLTTVHWLGKISDVPAQTDERQLQTVIGHNRYATSGEPSLANAQPYTVRDGAFALSLGHNGNIPEKCIKAVRESLPIEIRADASDSVILTEALMAARKRHPTWLETFIMTLPDFSGAFSLVCTTEEGFIYAARDPWGIRPLCIGRKDDSWIVASETVALDVIGAEYMRELLPGELICLKPNGDFDSVIYGVSSEGNRRCALEDIYFTRNKSYQEGAAIWQRRQALGRAAAARFKQKEIEIDLVVPILNSGKKMAVGVAEALEVELLEAIGVNGNKRTFIQNSQTERKKAVHEKHIVFNPEHQDSISGKRILLCDDSIIRGNSLDGLIEKVHAVKEEQRPTEIHVLIGSEPVVDTCDLGIDIPDQKNLLAVRLGGDTIAEVEQRVATYLGVDSVTYTDRESMSQALSQSSQERCWHCFGGDHPINGDKMPVYRADKLNALAQQKVLFLASGNEGIVQYILQEMANGRILAESIDITTDQQTTGMFASSRNELPTRTMASPETYAGQALRQDYERELLLSILQHPAGMPDVIVLTGWILALSDEFISTVTDQGIKVITTHSALLSETGSGSVMTSKGMVPEISSAHAINEAMRYTRDDLPVTGATVHEVTVGNQAGIGRVLLKEEVARREDDTVETLANRIKSAEQRILSVALQRVLLEQIQHSASPMQSTTQLEKALA